MKKTLLIENILKHSKTGILNELDLLNLIPGTADKRYGQVKRALAKEQLIHLRRGLYAIPTLYQHHAHNLFEIAAYLYAPSYISFESALSYHGWIPESVPITASATPKRKKNITTPLGVFHYLTVPVENAFCEVTRLESLQGQVFFMASPWKAIFDYIHVFKKDWTNLSPLFESLRIEADEMSPPSANELASIATQYQTARTDKFMKSLRKEFNL